MNKKGVSTFKVAATYIGTVVGAGFATGQEVLHFFTKFGIMGLAGLIVSTAMFIGFGYIIMDLGKKLRAHSHLEIIRYAGGRKLGTIIDLIITFFLFGSFTAMIAGTGALVKQQFNFPVLIGNILMGVLTALTVLTGIKGVINSISMVVPFLLVAVIGTSVYAIVTAPSVIPTAINYKDGGLVSNWLIATILYVSYNIVISIAVLGPLGLEAHDRKALRNGALLGGLGLGLGAGMIYLALSYYFLKIKNLEVPMIYIAGKMSVYVQVAYAIVLVAEIYTTAVGSLYGFVSRFTNINKNRNESMFIIAATTIAALLASQLGFSNLVKYLYPIEGYCGVVLLIALIYSKLNIHKFKR